jgi:hypothetical protein
MWQGILLDRAVSSKLCPPAPPHRGEAARAQAYKKSVCVCVGGGVVQEARKVKGGAGPQLQCSSLA